MKERILNFEQFANFKARRITIFFSTKHEEIERWFVERKSSLTNYSPLKQFSSNIPLPCGLQRNVQQQSNREGGKTAGKMARVSRP